MEFDDTKSQPSTRPPHKTATDVKADVRSTASEAVGATQRKVSETVTAKRDTIASEMEGLAHAADVAAEDLQGHQQTALSEYVTQFASSISDLANNLRHKSIDELIHEAEGIARRNPALFIGGSIAIGLGLARFAKASSHRSASESEHQYSQESHNLNEPQESGYSTNLHRNISQEQDSTTTYSTKGNGSTLSGGTL